MFQTFRDANGSFRSQHEDGVLFFVYTWLYKPLKTAHLSNYTIIATVTRFVISTVRGVGDGRYSSGAEHWQQQRGSSSTSRAICARMTRRHTQPVGVCTKMCCP